MYSGLSPPDPSATTRCRGSHFDGDPRTNSLVQPWTPGHPAWPTSDARHAQSWRPRGPRHHRWRASVASAYGMPLIRTRTASRARTSRARSLPTHPLPRRRDVAMSHCATRPPKPSGRRFPPPAPLRPLPCRKAGSDLERARKIRASRPLPSTCIPRALSAHRVAPCAAPGKTRPTPRCPRPGPRHRIPPVRTMNHLRHRHTAGGRNYQRTAPTGRSRPRPHRPCCTAAGARRRRKASGASARPARRPAPSARSRTSPARATLHPSPWRVSPPQQRARSLSAHPPPTPFRPRWTRPPRLAPLRRTPHPHPPHS